VARPKLEIDPQVVENYARHGATNAEIGAMVGCDERTVRRRFADFLAKGRSERRQKLREKQYDVALSGNVTMLIWLGKNELGQSDKAGGAADDDPEPELDPKVG
jgi:hypothetical protein